jgi:hypothetical protein
VRRDVVHADAVDAAVVVQQRGDVAAVAERDVLDRAHAPADEALEHRPAGDGVVRADRDTAQRVAVDGHAHFQRGAQRGRAFGDGLVAEAGEEALDGLLATGLQAVRVQALRHRAAVLGDALGKCVAVDDRDAVVGVSQDAGGEQAGHARTDDDRVLAKARSPGRVRTAWCWRPWRRSFLDDDRCALEPLWRPGRGAPMRLPRDRRFGLPPGRRSATVERQGRTVAVDRRSSWIVMQ